MFAATLLWAALAVSAPPLAASEGIGIELNRLEDETAPGTGRALSQLIIVSVTARSAQWIGSSKPR